MIYEIWKLHDGTSDYEVVAFNSLKEGEPQTVFIGTLEACRHEMAANDEEGSTWNDRS